jgi:hypothetical protein
MLTIKSTPGLTFGPIKEFVVLNFFFLCSLNVVFVLVKSGFCYLSREGQKNLKNKEKKNLTPQTPL